MAGRWKVAGRPHAAKRGDAYWCKKERDSPRAARFATLDLIQKHNAPATGELKDPIKDADLDAKIKTPSAEQSAAVNRVLDKPEARIRPAGAWWQACVKSSFWPSSLSGRSSSAGSAGHHIRACHWLEHRETWRAALLSHGFGKSTILAAYNAWRFWDDPAYRILHQGDQDRTAFKTSRETRKPYSSGTLDG